MKNQSLLFAILLIVPIALNAQESCKVLLPGIDSLYKGECDKGLANGKGEAWGVNHYIGTFKKGLPEGDGTCEYADGGVYTGQWKKGMRHGVGKMRAVVNNKDTLMNGIWKVDSFTGKAYVPPAYRIVTSIGATKVRVYKQGEGNEVRFEIKDTASGQKGALDMMSGSSGSETTWSNQYGFASCNFPFTGKIRVWVANKINSSLWEVSVEVEIYEKGLWIVEIYV